MRPRFALALGLIVAFAWQSGCVRVGFDAALREHARDGGVDRDERDLVDTDGVVLDVAFDADGVTPDTASVPADISVDVDGVASDTASVLSDISVDVDISRQLVCGAAQIVGSNQPAGLSSPSVLPDGLMVVAEHGNQRSAATRSDLDASFGAWASYSDPWAATANKSDFAFFEEGGAVHAIVAIAGTGGNRSLYYCPGTAGSCGEVMIFDNGGSPLTGNADLDGPSVSTSLTAGLKMLINVDISGSPRAIYAATPRDSGLTVWDAAPLFVSPTSSTYDDASIAANRSLIVLPDVAGSPARILASFRLSNGEYGPLHEIDLGTADASSPAVFQRPDESYEIFFDDATLGVVYHTRCL